MHWIFKTLIDGNIEPTQQLRFFLGQTDGCWPLVLLLLAAAYCIWSYARIRTRLHRGYRALMIGTRLAMLIVIAGLLLRPGLQYSELQVPIVALLIDSSASMAVRDAEDPAAARPADNALPLDHADSSAQEHASRIELAAATAESLARDIRGTQNRGYEVRYFGFDSQLVETTTASIRAQGPRTDIAAAARELACALRGQPLLAVALFTDGVHNAGGDVPSALRFFADRQIPVHTVSLGSDREQADLRLAQLHSPRFVFEQSQFSLEARLAWHGLEGSCEVRLLEDDKQIDVERVELAKPQGAATVRFECLAESIGKHFYRVQITPRDSEVTTRNNGHLCSVEVLEDLRLLYVTATPRAEFTFLRRYLEHDSRVQVTSLLAVPGKRGRFYNRSKQASDRQFAFPETEQQLGRYQVVILGDIEQQMFTTAQLELLRAYVSQGGGFLMLGGRHSFGSGGYADTPIADLLPVRLSAGERHLEQPFIPALTPAGAESTFYCSTAFATDEFSWEQLPQLGGLNVVEGSKPGATVLAIHPESNAIVQAIARFGKGRSMALTVDETWRWRLEQAYAEQNPAGRFYQDFWGQVVRWLGIPAERPGLRVSLPRPNITLGERARIQVQLLDESLSPLAAAKPRLQLRRFGDADWLELQLATDDASRGLYLAEWDPSAANSFELRAAVSVDGAELEDREVLAVREPSGEMERTARDKRMLESIAELTGGRHVEVGDAEHLLTQIAGIPYSQRRRFYLTKETEIWDAWSVLVLLIGLVSLEWFWRRKAGVL